MTVNLKPQSLSHLTKVTPPATNDRWFKRFAAWLKAKGRHRMIWRDMLPQPAAGFVGEEGKHRFNERTKKWEERYLERHYVLSTPLFGVYIHRFWADDIDGLHDHPWDSFSWLLEGGYLERIAGETQPIIRMEGDTHYRPATESHRITLLPGEQPGSCWTLFIRFRRKRLWGFYQSEWIPAPTQSRRDD